MKQIVQMKPDALELALGDHAENEFEENRELYGYFFNDVFWGGVKGYIENKCGVKFRNNKADLNRHDKELIEKYWGKYDKVRDKFIFHKNNIYSYQFLGFGNIGNVIGIIKYEPLDLIKVCRFAENESPSLITLPYIYKYLNERKDRDRGSLKGFLFDSGEKKINQATQEILGTAAIYAKSPYFSPLVRNEFLKQYVVGDHAKAIFQSHLENVCLTLPMLIIENIAKKFGGKNDEAFFDNMQETLSKRSPEQFKSHNGLFLFIMDEAEKVIKDFKYLSIADVGWNHIHFKTKIIDWLFSEFADSTPVNSDLKKLIKNLEEGNLQNNAAGKLVHSLGNEIYSIFLMWDFK